MFIFYTPDHVKSTPKNWSIEILLINGPPYHLIFYFIGKYLCDELKSAKCTKLNVVFLNRFLFGIFGNIINTFEYVYCGLNIHIYIHYMYIKLINKLQLPIALFCDGVLTRAIHVKSQNERSVDIQIV